MKPDNRIPGVEMYKRTGAVRGAIFVAAILSALLSLALASALNPAAAENGPATISATSKENEQETVEVTYDESELEMAGLINDYREEKGLDPLLVSDTASLAAKRHSEDMARYGYMDHDSQDSAYFDHGASFDERLAESGYDHNTALAENIAAGANVEEIFEGWKDSPDHEKNMLDPGMEIIGIGLSTEEDSGDSADPADSGTSESSQQGEYDSYWTTDFGGETDRTAKKPSKIQAEPNADEPKPDEPGDQHETAPEETTDNATIEQSGQESKPGTEDEAAPDDGTGSTGGEDGTSGDPSESGDDTGDGEQGVTEEQYSTGDEDPADKDSSNEGSADDEEGISGDQITEESTTEESTTEESTTEQSATEQPSEDQGEEDSSEQSGGGRDCDTLAGFDKSPFDADFGSELSRLIRAKVDCKLTEAGIGGEEAEDGQDGTVAGSDNDTTGQKPDADASTSDNGDGGQNLGPATDGSTGESAPEPGDEPDAETADEPTDEPDEATPAVLGPASTESASPNDTGRED